MKAIACSTRAGGASKRWNCDRNSPIVFLISRLLQRKAGPMIRARGRRLVCEGLELSCLT